MYWRREERERPGSLCLQLHAWAFDYQVLFIPQCINKVGTVPEKPSRTLASIPGFPLCSSSTQLI
ncbi:hypothetical protein E2C01_033022 [Portunus trituberculatus]|uniref:Uncharacterized protein n=1 Tax=Portunus trituberculatus TaxID=210409 RepID=A0A5B7F4I9_PORTR|nr:hypothetical protein [Portunus trituberculatus]